MVLAKVLKIEDINIKEQEQEEDVQDVVEKTKQC